MLVFFENEGLNSRALLRRCFKETYETRLFLNNRANADKCSCNSRVSQIVLGSGDGVTLRENAHQRAPLLLG